MGSGKSSIGRLVAERAGAPFNDLDAAIERAAGMAISELWAVKGEDEFRRLEASLLADVLEAGSVAALGGGAPLSASNWRLIAERSVSVFLDVPFDQVWERIAPQTHRPLVRGRSRQDIEALLERRRPLYRRADFTVDAGRDPATVAEEVLALWSK